MANGTGVGMGLGARTTSTSTGKKSTSRTGGTGKKSTGPVGEAGGRPGAGRPAGGVAAGGRPDLVRMGQLLSGGGAPGAGGIPGAGVPAGMPGMFRAGIPSGGMPVSVGGLPTTPGDSSQYDFGMQDMGDLASLDFGPERGIPDSYISGRGGVQIGSISKQDVSGFRNNLTMSKLENLSPEEKTAFDERMVEATKRKESLKWPMGVDPELMEQRITAAESEKWPNSSDFYKKLRSFQTEPTTLQNVGSMLKKGAKGVGSYLQNLGQHTGVYQKPLWPATGHKQAEGWDLSNIMHGEGTPVDQNKTIEFIRNKRAENYAAGITVPPEQEWLAHYMLGNEGREKEKPYGMHFRNAPDLFFPSPQQEPSGAVKSYRERSVLPSSSAPSRSAFLQQPTQSMGYGRYGGGGGTKEEEEKKTFNLLEMLMGLLGLGGGKGTRKSPQKNLNREPGPGEIDTRPAQLGVEPGIG